MIHLDPSPPIVSPHAGLPADDAVLVLDRFRRIRQATPEAATLLDLSLHKMLGRDWAEFAPLDPSRFIVREQPVYGRTRHPTLFVVTLRLVPAAQDDHHALVTPWEHSIELACARGADGRILAVNQAFARKFGVARASWPGRDLEALVHPEDRPEWLLGCANRRRAPHRASWEVRLQTAQGWRWLSWEESAVRNDAGEIVAYRAIGRDVTKRRLAEEHFSKLASAVDQAPISIVVTTPDTRVQYVNPRYSQTTGYTLEEIYEKQIPVLREGHATDESYRAFLETVEAGRKWSGEVSTRCKDGRMLYEFMMVSPIRDATNKITQLLCVREDVTERKRLEDQLRQSQKMECLGALAGGIAHDFNNMLAIINGFAELALNLGTADDFQRKYLKEIHNAGQRAIGLVRQILTFSRKTEISFRPVSLNELVHDLGRLFTETFPRTIAFDFDLDTTLPPLAADQNQLQQVILNLCVNARDAMPQGGRLSLATAQVAGDTLVGLGGDAKKRYVHIRVSDTGVGMPPHVKTRIFEPFFTTKQTSGGTGLGLAVVYGIILSHKGLLEVDTAPGHGSTFHVYLPLEVAEAVQVPVESKALAGIPAGTESVLIVEDESSLRDLLRTVLSQRGYTVHIANDGEEALNFLMGTSHAVDAVLLDLNLPKLNGVEVFKILRRTRPDAKTLVLSGNLTPEAKRELMALGQREFIAKPYTLADLGQCLRRMLGHPAASAA